MGGRPETETVAQAGMGFNKKKAGACLGAELIYFVAQSNDHL
jgi:hypothetical protein